MEDLASGTAAGNGDQRPDSRNYTTVQSLACDDWSGMTSTKLSFLAATPPFLHPFRRGTKSSLSPSPPAGAQVKAEGHSSHAGSRNKTVQFCDSLSWMSGGFLEHTGHIRCLCCDAARAIILGGSPCQKEYEHPATGPAGAQNNATNQRMSCAGQSIRKLWWTKPRHCAVLLEGKSL